MLHAELRWFLDQLRPVLGRHVLSVGLLVLGSVMFLLDPLLIKWMIDVVLPKKDYHLLILGVAGFFGIYIARLVLSSFGAALSFRTMQELVVQIRLTILEQMNRLSADYHEATAIGEKLYRTEQEVDQVAELGSNLVPFVLQTAFTTIFVITTMLIVNFQLTCIVLPLMPLFVIFQRRFQGRLQRASDCAQRQSSLESSFLQEHLGAIVQVQLLRQEQSQTQDFMKRALARVKALNDRAFLEITFGTWYMAVIALGTVAILGYGGYQVVVGALTVGGLVAFYSYLARLFDPLHGAVDIYSRLNRLSTSIRRILEILETRPTIHERRDAISLPPQFRPTVEMESVLFQYADGRYVLNGLDLSVNEGEKLALVGVSGSGKSTVAKVVARLYDVNRGAVKIGGTDVRRIQLANLRAQVCYVMQDPVLFDRTLKENLLLGNPRATTEELWQAVEIAGLGEVVYRLPHGWDAHVGPRGNALSGGERQRVALARAVLQKPTIMLLDESTSALDAPAERQIFLNLAKSFRDQTIVFITHRLSAVKWADRIVVLDQGRIREQGTHDHLMNRDDLYARLCNSRIACERSPTAF